MSLKVVFQFGVRLLNSKYSNIGFSKAITNFTNSRSVSSANLKTFHVRNNSFLTSQKCCRSSVPLFSNSKIRGLSSSADLKLLKKRSHKKRYSSEVDPENMEEGYFTVFAFATAKEYNLEQLKMALLGERLYLPQKLVSMVLCNQITIVQFENSLPTDYQMQICLMFCLLQRNIISVLNLGNYFFFETDLQYFGISLN